MTRPIQLLLLIILTICRFAAPVNAGETNILEGYLRIALDQNDEIRAARARLDASSERVRQAGTLPDPRLGVEYFLQPIETRTGPQESSINLSQSFPWFGKLDLEKKLTRSESDIAEARLLFTQLKVARQIKETYIEYGYLRQAEISTGQIFELMQYLDSVAQTKYAGGKSTYTDVLKIQIELARLDEKIRSLADNAAPVRIRLNSLLGVDRDMARKQPETLPEVRLAVNSDEILTLARSNNPRILAGHHKITGSKTSLDIADKDFFPDFTVNVKTIFTGEAEFGDPPDSGRDSVIAGLSINLPVFRDRRHGAIAEKQALIRTARNELEQIWKDLEAEIELSLFRYRDAERRLNLYKTSLIPKINQELEVALEAFQADQYSILEIIDAERSWFNFELARLRAQADMAIEIARLEDLAGTTLSEWNTTDSSPGI